MTAQGVHNTKDMYHWYKKKHPTSDINYTQYNYIICEYYKEVVKKVLEGKTFNLGDRLGKISIKKVKRNFANPTIDWGETNKLREKTGICKYVYYTDEYWYRWAWSKKNCQVKNKTVYRFQPTKGPNGNTKKLVNKLKEDEFSYLLYSE